MATVMTWGNSEGTKGRCDAKCHGATQPECDCMCGGRYHGSRFQLGGVEEAVRQFGQEVLREAEARAEREGYVLKRITPIEQGELHLA